MNSKADLGPSSTVVFKLVCVSIVKHSCESVILHRSALEVIMLSLLRASMNWRSQLPGA